MPPSKVAAVAVVKAPLRLMVAAPPVRSITFVAGVVPAKLIPPLAFNVPVVITIRPIRLAVALVPAKLIKPLTVAVCALIFHTFVKLLAAG